MKCVGHHRSYTPVREKSLLSVHPHTHIIVNFPYQGELEGDPTELSPCCLTIQICQLRERSVGARPELEK